MLLMRNGILQNNEGISPVLGFILMLAIGVTILSTVQLSFVPVWNTQEELNHLKLMQDDFKVLKSNIDSGILGGTTLSSPLIMGFKYSPKMMVYNPKDEAYASLEVRKDAWVEVRYNEVFPEGMTDDTSIKNVSTGMIIYALQGARNYNSFIYENGLIRRSGSNFTTSSQTVLANGTIYLPSVKALDYGSLSGVEKKTVNIYPTSQQKNSVIGRNVWLILRTKPDPGGYVEWWAKTLESEGAGIRKKDPSSGIVIANVSESLVIKMGEAYISAASKASPAHSPPSRLVRVSSKTAVLPVDGVTDLIVEVQDEYNNPVPNVLVSFDENLTKVPGNTYLNDVLLQRSAVSGSDGRASVQLKTNGAGFYYIDAIIPEYNTTFAYSASSQGTVMELDYSPKIPSSENFNVTATLKDSLGTLVPGSIQVTFETGDGSITSPVNTVGGTANTTLNVSDATGIKITNIQAKDITTNAVNITWNTVNNITVTAKSGYVFNFINVPTNVDTYGCVFYGTVPGIYTERVCNFAVLSSTHSFNISGLTQNTAYYFILNSSRPDMTTVDSTEYIFVTEKLGDDGVPPASITGLSGTPGALSINWTWNDPSDEDFDHVDIYIDGVSKGTRSKGEEYFNAYYFLPGTSHTISTRTVDINGRINETWKNDTAMAGSAYTYVYSFSPIGSVTNPDDAKDATDGLSAIMAEDMVGGTNKSNRTKSPGKIIDLGAQSGIFDSSNLDVEDSNIDITLPEKQIKTVVYYMGQKEDPNELLTGTLYTASPVDIYLPEQEIVVKKAWLELQQLSGTSAAANVNTIDMFLNGVDYSVIKGGTYQTNSAESLVTIARADVTSAFSTFVNPTSYTAAVRTVGPRSNAQAILLYVTYEYDPASPVQLKTVRYPLDTNIGLRAIGSTTTFNYIASIPEAAATIRSSWFEIRGLINNPNNVNDATISAKIEPNATYSTGVSLDMANRDMFGFLYLFKTTTSEFSPNSPQTLTVRNLGQIVYALGGEVVVTYEYPISAPVQLKTVKYFVGQQTVRYGLGTFSDFTTVFIPEQSVNIKSVFARVRATESSTVAGTGTQTITGSMGGTGTASQAYTVDMNTELIGNYVIIYNMTSAASSLVNNTVVFVNNTFSRNNHGPPGTELYITYEYDPSSPSELKTVEYPAGQSAVQFATRNENFEIFVPEKTATRRSAYIDYAAMSSATGIFTISSAIDTVFSSQTVSMDNTGEPLTASALNGDSGSRITAASNVYDINYSSSAAVSFSGVARLTYEFRKNNSLDVIYTISETNSSSSWKSISIQDRSYGDALADVSILNFVSGMWESLFPTGFNGGTSPIEHVTRVVGASGNAGDYDYAGSGQIKIKYNWTGAVVNNKLGVDLLNVTVNYASGGVYRLDITSNTTGIPDATNHELQIRYNVSGDNFTLQVWNGAWDNKTTLTNTTLDYYNYALLPGELQSDVSTAGGNAGNIAQYYVLVRYLDLISSGVQGNLYLDYQRVYSS